MPFCTFQFFVKIMLEIWGCRLSTSAAYTRVFMVIWNLFLFLFFVISACSSGSFGANCSQKCLCLNGGMCDPVDGHCNCKPGWAGSFCQQRKQI